MIDRSFAALGQKLRERREEKGLSSRQLAERTRIPLNILETLEDGRANGLPAPVFVKGFLRSLSIELGLDHVEIIREYKVVHPDTPDQIGTPITARKAPHAPSAGRTAFLVALLLLTVLGGAFIYYYPRWLSNLFQESGPGAETRSREITRMEPSTTGPITTPEPAAPPAPTPHLSSPTTPASAPEPLAPEPPKPPVAAETAATPPVPAVPAKIMSMREATALARMAPANSNRHELKVVFEKESWIQVILDGQATMHGLYGPGTTKTWKAERSFALRLGNAGGVRIFYDGQAMGIPGPEGKAVSLNLPRND